MSIRRFANSYDNGSQSGQLGEYPSEYTDYEYQAQQYYYPSYGAYYYPYDENKAPTGVYYLDYLLQGGFRRGETYLIAGEAGQGKTIFAIQFLKTGAELGEPGLYITIDEPSEDVKRGTRDALGWDLEQYESRGLLTFIDLRTHFKIYAKEERIVVDPKDIANLIIDQVRKGGIRRVVIDPIAPLIITSHADVLWVREYMRELVLSLKRVKDVVTVMTSEIPTGENKISRFGVEEYLAGGVIKLELNEYKGWVFRVMFIRKMRWTPIRPLKLVFEISQPHGIQIVDTLENFLTRVDSYLSSLRYQQA